MARLADEDVHVVVCVEDGAESLRLGLEVDGHLGQEDGVDV